MAISSVGSYTNSYENLYTYNQTKKSETSEISEVKTETTKKSNNEEYLKSLQKQVPYMKLQIGYGLNTSNDGKVNVVDVNPKLVEKMQNDPKAAKEYTQRLKDVESALKWLDNYKKSVGSTVIVRHDYIDENGNLSHFLAPAGSRQLPPAPGRGGRHGIPISAGSGYIPSRCSPGSPAPAFPVPGAFPEAPVPVRKHAARSADCC